MHFYMRMRMWWIINKANKHFSSLFLHLPHHVSMNGWKRFIYLFKLFRTFKRITLNLKCLKRMNSKPHKNPRSQDIVLTNPGIDIAHTCHWVSIFLEHFSFKWNSRLQIYFFVESKTSLIYFYTYLYIILSNIFLNG